MDCRQALGALALAPVGATTPRTLTRLMQASSFRARLSHTVTPFLSQKLGNQDVVENRAGGATSVASRSLARATPDGHTVRVCDVACTLAPSLFVNPGFDPQKDLADR